ncbi:ATPase family associated with various cellular activities (AAA) [Marinobacter sp. es.048]|uniref:AAA family ATPase n=1 Tax=Marinobacter sp. es.048 TaxID=1761795 RepID=UPI000B66ED52|nr:AAA family ATPase [Marinobacter sp. es.048]SNC59336.1 ATPase family associated with various cellular activities (AAA) [Marinobacter sp. es.048]
MSSARKTSGARNENKGGCMPNGQTIEDAIIEQMRTADQKKRVVSGKRAAPSTPKTFEVVRKQGWERLKETVPESDEQEVSKERIVENGQIRRLHNCREEVLKLLEALLREFPNFREVTKEIIGSYRISMIGGSPLSLPVINLQGPPGIGKTTYVRAVALALGLPFHDLKISQMMEKFEIAGMSKGWKGARPGKIARIMLEEEPIEGQPVILFDELCMAKDTAEHSVVHPLYTLFDRDSGEYFRDLCLDVPINTSHLLMFSTTNNVEVLRPALRSRLSSFDIEAPGTDEMRSLAQNLYRQLLGNFNMTDYFPALLGHDVLKKVTDGSIREMKRNLQRAIVRAVAESGGQTRFTLKVGHLPDAPSRKQPIGF